MGRFNRGEKMDNSLWPIVGALIVFVVLLYPYVRIIRQAGYSGWWVLILFVPLVNIVMLWVFALARWPALHRTGPAASEV
jgi:uncharacterized membrane protein YhaH (DUF805 family)